MRINRIELALVLTTVQVRLTAHCCAKLSTLSTYCIPNIWKILVIFTIKDRVVHKIRLTFAPYSPSKNLVFLISSTSSPWFLIFGDILETLGDMGISWEFCGNSMGIAKYRNKWTGFVWYMVRMVQRVDPTAEVGVIPILGALKRPFLQILAKFGHFRPIFDH